MADPKVRFKRSSVPGKIPNETQVPLGEIALNTYDGKVFASKNVGIGTTVFTVNPWNVGTGTDVYDINFTAGNVGIGSTLPTSKLDVTGNAKVSGIVTATSFSGSGSNLTGIVTSITAGSGISIDQSTGNVTITSTGGAGAGVSALTSADNYVITLTPSFNGITTAFTMQYNGNNYSPLNAQQLLVSLGGVIQEPTSAYTVSSSTITFASAPNTQTSYFITALNTAPLSRNAQSYNVTGVQTNFTLTNGYTIGYVDVYLNGARLVSGDDYTATNGTTVGLTSAAQNGDVVEVVGYKAVSLSTDDLVINGNLKVVGITTLGNYVQVGVGSTALIVNGDARVTGILTVGSSSVTIDGINNRINVGTGLTISNGIVATGVITATSFVGDGSGLTGAGSTVVDDTSTNQTLYPVLTAQTSGTITASKVSTTKLSFNPSTGVVSGTGFSGSGANLTSLNATQLTSGTVPAARITSTNALSVGGDLYVSGNISFGGTTTQLNTTQVTFSDPDIVLGVGTTSTFNPTDNTANHGGIAVASTEGSPLVNLNINPGEILPTTYKKIMWFKNNAAGLGTDAWLSNYAVGIGSTQFPTGTRLVAGNVQFDANDLKVVRHINSSGVVTATSFSGNLTGNVTGNLNSSGVSTFSNGPVFIGSGTSTGTASQPLQVTGGAYFSGNIGIGATNPAGFTNGTQLGLSGYNAGGGVGYHQFLAVTNTYGSATNPSKFFRLNSTGGVEVVNNAYTTIIFSLDNSGNISVPGNVTAYSSDERLKENIKNIENSVEKVLQLNGCTFDWNKKSKELGFTPKHETNDIGLLAQEVEKVLPQAVAPAPFDRETNEFGENVSKSGENYLTIQYERLVPLLVEAIKEQQKQINILKEEINNLKK